MKDLEKEYCDNYIKEIFKVYPELLKRLIELHGKKQEMAICHIQ